MNAPAVRYELQRQRYDPHRPASGGRYLGRSERESASRAGPATNRRQDESFNGRLRDELLNETLFRSLPHACVALDNWRWDYNTKRPHSSLGWQTPLAFAAAWQRRCARRDRTLPRSEGVAPGPVASDAENTFNHRRTLVPRG